MTAAMAAMHRQLPWHERYHLPPHEITERAAVAVGVHHQTDDRTRQMLTGAGHFGYGAACGGLCAAVVGALHLAGALIGVPPSGRLKMRAFSTPVVAPAVALGAALPELA